MSYSNARAALDTALQTAADGLELDVLWENMERVETDAREYLSAAMLPNEPEAASIGINGEERVRGIYQVNVNTHRDIGSGRAFAIADALTTAFARGSHLTHSGFVITVERSWPGPALIDGDFYIVPLSVAWYGFK